MSIKLFCCPHCDEEHDIDIDAKVVMCSCQQVTILHEHQANLVHASCRACETHEFELARTMSRINMHFQFLGDEYIPKETKNYVMDELRQLMNSIRKQEGEGSD